MNESNEKMQSPRFLKKGDKVLIIATARARDLPAIQPAIDILNAWGFVVEIGPNALKKHHQFAGTDAERAADLQWALDHAEARAIVISGGGYGALRIIDRISFSKFRANPKWVVGYSDTTVLHSRLLREGFCAIHGTMAFQFSKDRTATESVRALLTGESPRFVLPAGPVNRNGTATGEMVGGNLSLLYALSGSVDEQDMKGKILFIEDLDEQLYHVDRMMRQLKRAGKLSGLAGLVVGGMTEMKDNAVPFGQTAEEIIRECVEEYRFPLAFNFPSGHIERNMAFYLGKKAELKVNEQGVELFYPE